MASEVRMMVPRGSVQPILPGKSLHGDERRCHRPHAPNFAGERHLNASRRICGCSRAPVEDRCSYANAAISTGEETARHRVNGPFKTLETPTHSTRVRSQRYPCRRRCTWWRSLGCGPTWRAQRGERTREATDLDALGLARREGQRTSMRETSINWGSAMRSAGEIRS